MVEASLWRALGLGRRVRCYRSITARVISPDGTSSPSASCRAAVRFALCPSATSMSCALNDDAAVGGPSAATITASTAATPAERRRRSCGRVIRKVDLIGRVLLSRCDGPACSLTDVQCSLWTDRQAAFAKRGLGRTSGRTGASTCAARDAVPPQGQDDGPAAAQAAGTEIASLGTPLEVEACQKACDARGGPRTGHESRGTPK